MVCAENENLGRIGKQLIHMAYGRPGGCYSLGVCGLHDCIPTAVHPQLQSSHCLIISSKATFQ